MLHILPSSIAFPYPAHTAVCLTYLYLLWCLRLQPEPKKKRKKNHCYNHCMLSNNLNQNILQVLLQYTINLHLATPHKIEQSFYTSSLPVNTMSTEYFPHKTYWPKLFNTFQFWLKPNKNNRYWMKTDIQWCLHLQHNLFVTQ